MSWLLRLCLGFGTTAYAKFGLSLEVSLGGLQIYPLIWLQRCEDDVRSEPDDMKNDGEGQDDCDEFPLANTQKIKKRPDGVVDVGICKFSLV